MLGPRVLEHPVLADPLLTQLPDLVLGLLPAEDYSLNEGSSCPKVRNHREGPY